MKILKVGLLIATIFILGFGCNNEKIQSVSSNKNVVIEQIKDKVDISRKDELELEGFINDYFHRRHIKDPVDFSDFDAYASVISKSIVIYIYPKTTLGIDRSDYLKNLIKTDIQNELLSFQDFEWTKDYSFNIVIR